MSYGLNETIRSNPYTRVRFEYIQKISRTVKHYANGCNVVASPHTVKEIESGPVRAYNDDNTPFTDRLKDNCKFKVGSRSHNHKDQTETKICTVPYKTRTEVMNMSIRCHKHGHTRNTEQQTERGSEYSR